MKIESYFLWIGFASSAYMTFGYKKGRGTNTSVFFHFVLRIILAIIGVFISKSVFNLLNSSNEVSWNGGFIYIGFLSSFILYYLLEAYWGKVPKVSNSFATPLLLSYSIGRIGCYFAGCCFGDIFTMPVQLFESILALVLFSFLSIKRNLGDFKIYLFSYFSFRFFTEFFREDIVRGVHNGVSTTQWIILFYVFIFVLLKIFFERKIPEHRALI